MADSRTIGSLCASCLSRLRISNSPATVSNQVSAIRSFHSTKAVLNVNKKKSTVAAGARNYGHREARSATFKRKKREKPSIPQVGERRAARKRIVLSNTNALPVEDMQDLSVENMTNQQLEGQMVGLPGDLLDQLRAVGSFKTSQKNWAMFRQPGILVRKETIELANILKSVDESAKDKGKVIRSIIDGPKMTGKSLLLLQAMSMAFLNDWVVINIPEAQEFTIAHSSYRPSNQTPDGQQLYTQPDLTAEMLKRIARSNQKVLSKLSLVHEHPDFPEPLQSNISLDRLAERGVSNPSQAPKVFSALWKELTVPGSKEGQSRPPILVSIDGLNQLMSPTSYRAPDFSLIHAHQFTLISHFLSLLFGTPNVATGQPTTFGPSGGMIFAATTTSNIPSNYSFSMSLSQLSAAHSGISPSSPSFPLPKAFSNIDKRVIEMFNSSISAASKASSTKGKGNSDVLGYMNLPGLSKPEAKGLLEYFARSGLLRERVTDDFVNEKWSLAGGGIAGFVERGVGRIRV